MNGANHLEERVVDERSEAQAHRKKRYRVGRARGREQLVTEF